MPNVPGGGFIVSKIYKHRLSYLKLHISCKHPIKKKKGKRKAMQLIKPSFSQVRGFSQITFKMEGCNNEDITLYPSFIHQLHCSKHCSSQVNQKPH